MLKVFQCDGYAVNKRGLTKGVHYTVTAMSNVSAAALAARLAEKEGYSFININHVREVSYVH
ncbi:hypothetical protein OML00_001910 [Salmonella enterica]|nr:hypothetical protein [Salmonella enterica]OIN37253.1 hypothetical protein AO411_2007970 [Salmonella enterica subsp. enterica serovar Sarajane]EAN3902584.1 hypothetical protein [Salmonella enterica]EAS5537823.1 hypothetical protein [Salmonella enterica]ECP1263719.1 hypothetical protein [Salmonella enterica]